MARRTIFGWLVEQGPPEAPAYLRFGPPHCSPGWTMDRLQAVRFARRQDAEAARQCFLHDIGRVELHIFNEEPAHA